ncbi:ABC transporter ATP-binding protein [Pseudonocardiaceae bacterium YIM PH 21723]|nr:ABC transporter ATP-binding protein [Pseudonocardiaceae bacterium YIM PH 21723]
MTLDANLVAVQGDFRLSLPLTVDSGRTCAILGPNGAGKSTALRTVAGLHPLSGGHITIAGRPVDRLSARDRRVGLVFQDYLLFDHLTVLENVAFGLRARRASDVRDKALHWLDRVGLADYADRRPRQLSGGQAQRVALARALVTEPDVLLLDEPLAALDVAARAHVRAELRGWLADYTGATLLVTHDPLDAMVLADEMVVLEGGVVVQRGTPAEVATHPRTPYVATLVGLNLYRGSLAAGVVTLESGSLTVTSGEEGEVLVAFPPSAVGLYPARPEGSPRNCWPVTVSEIEPHTGTVRVRLTGSPDVQADITTAAVAELSLSPGTRLWATVKATEIRTYPV